MKSLFEGIPARGCVMLAVLLVALLVAPFFANDYFLTVLILILYYAFTGQAWNIMMGFAGQLSLGHALYTGLGSYVTAALYVHYGIGPWVGLPAAILIAAAAGAVIGFLAFRFGVAGVYFAILTIAFAEFARIGFDHFRWVGGSAGFFLPVTNYAQNDLWQLRGQPVMFYYVILAMTLAALLFVPPAAAEPHGLLLAGDPRGRDCSARARHQHIPVQDVRRHPFGRDDFVRRHVLCLLLQQPVSRAGVQHRCVRSSSCSDRLSAASAP